MRIRIFKLLFFIFLLAIIFLAGCDGNGGNSLKPDLVPFKPLSFPGGLGYCSLDDSGNLKVYVENQGNADASGTTVGVKFYVDNAEIWKFATVGPISAGDTEVVLIPIPNGCFNPDCDFTITVDYTNTVIESNELNNTSVQAWCPG